MYVRDGIAYAGELAPDITVTSARYTGNSQLLVTFSTGETRLLDAYDLVGMQAFAPLADEETFRSFSVDRGVLGWLGGDIDIAPEGLYEVTYEYQEPPATA